MAIALEARSGILPKTEFRKKVTEVVLYTAEKSTYITVPATLLALASGGVAPAVGLALLGLDIGGGVGAKWMRNRSKNKNG